MKHIDCCEHCVPPERHIGCHSDCKKYIEQAATCKEERVKAYKYNHPEGDMYFQGKIKEYRRHKLKEKARGKKE